MELERLYRIGLNHCYELGLAGMQGLLNAFGSAESIWKASFPAQRQVLDEKRALALQKHIQTTSLEQLKTLGKTLEEKGISTLMPGDPDYPDCFTPLYRPPYLLYYRGHLEALKTSRKVGMIGTRRPSSYGKEATLRFSETLAHSGIAIVSGLAYGIDAHAHQGCLNASGITLAVLGSGLNRIAPAGNRNLAQHILQKGGLLLSEFPPDFKGSKWSYPQRNRLVAALSEALLVMEATHKSGTFITVDFGLELGIPIFALPGSVFSVNSEGTHRLIKEGASPLLSCEDFLKEMNWEASEAPSICLTKAEKEVYVLLKSKSQQIEVLAQALDYPASAILQLLTLMELKGLVEELPGKRYRKRRE